jgi:hypothetical protein
MLGNVDYRRHMTDEGDQLQRGLEHAGWTVAGVGFGDGCNSVPELLERHSPDVVIVHDKRDWDPGSRISFRKDVGFKDLGELARRKNILKLAVVKDAATFQAYHQSFLREVAADIAIVYYNEDQIHACAPWMSAYPKIRTWHTVDADLVRAIPATDHRKSVVVSGAIGEEIYPARTAIVKAASRLGIDVLRHPGYGNRGCRTEDYLRALAEYRAHIATASKYGFALRKIVESVAVGCIPVTNLPEADVLPAIDGALRRFDQNWRAEDIVREAKKIADGWHEEDVMAYSRSCLEVYDYRAMGHRLNCEVEDAYMGGW